MLGFYDYTVVLTYLSLLSAGSGIVVSLSDGGHPYWGIFFLLLCGLFDAFDGKVARTKKNRTQMEMNYGIQIDSLADVIAFGVLPAVIGIALLRTSPYLRGAGLFGSHWTVIAIKIFLYAILMLYILAALIRLAYFNVTEEERQRTEGGVRKYYTGLPVTSSALIFPTVMLLRYLFLSLEISLDLSIIYIPVALLTAFLFLSKIKVPKPGLRGILLMIGVGVLECIVLAVCLALHINHVI